MPSTNEYAFTYGDYVYVNGISPETRNSSLNRIEWIRSQLNEIDGKRLKVYAKTMRDGSPFYRVGYRFSCWVCECDLMTPEERKSFRKQIQEISEKDVMLLL